MKMGLVLAAISLGGFAGCYTKLMPFRDAVAVRKASVAQSEKAGNFTSNIDYRDNCLSCHSEAELNDRAAEMDYAGIYTVHGVTYDPYGWQNPYSQPPWWDPTPAIFVNDPGWGGGYHPGTGISTGVGNQPIGGYSPGSGYQPSGGTPTGGGRQPVITTQPTVPSTPASAASPNGKRRRDTGSTRTGSDSHQANPTATSTPSGGTSTPSSTPSGSGGVTTTPPATTQAPAATPAPATTDTRSRGTEGSGTRKSGSGRD